MASPNAQKDSSLGTIATLTTASAGATGTNLDASQHRGIQVFVNITAITGTTPSLTVSVKGQSPQGVDYTILTSAAITAAGMTVLTVYPQLPAVANVTAQATVPTTVHVDYAIAGTTPAVTATIAAVLLY